jgi:Mrp family chromosome partitioning ATPase
MSEIRTDQSAASAIRDRQATVTAATDPVYRVGDKTIRLDSADRSRTPAPHVEPGQVPAQTISVSQTATSWDAGVGVVEMGLGHVVTNNEALQQAIRELTVQPPTVASTSGTLGIKPAWEVDYFRWPRLTRRLLQTHPQLFDGIGGQILQELQPTQARIGVCSTFAREGKTTIATCLARWSALQGKRTLLIDADVERPRMTLICGLTCTFGWQSLLDSRLAASEAMIRSVESGLVFMPARVESMPRLEHKALERLGMVTFQMKYEFDFVVIDMGTIDNICAHGRSGMDVVDGMLVIRDPARSSTGQMMDTRRVLENLGIDKTWTVRNFARSTLNA